VKRTNLTQCVSDEMFAHATLFDVSAYLVHLFGGRRPER